MPTTSACLVRWPRESKTPAAGEGEAPVSRICINLAGFLDDIGVEPKCETRGRSEMILGCESLVVESVERPCRSRQPTTAAGLLRVIKSPASCEPQSEIRSMIPARIQSQRIDGRTDAIGGHATTATGRNSALQYTAQLLVSACTTMLASPVPWASARIAVSLREP